MPQRRRAPGRWRRTGRRSRSADRLAGAVGCRFSPTGAPALTAEFTERTRDDEAARRLTTIPGIGAINATALVAAIGMAETFRKARDLAAWLGLVPRQATTGGKPRLIGITKRGNAYLRTTLIHGARAALPSLSPSLTPMGAWLRGLLTRMHKNKVVVALAGKLARIAWSVLRSGESYVAGAAVTS